MKRSAYRIESGGCEINHYEVSRIQHLASFYHKRVLSQVVLVVLALAQLIQNSFADTIDDQVREISYLLMCPVCQGQSVEESNSGLANDMRAIIRKKLEEGKSKEEIIAYFVDRYGETILGAPPAKGVNWLLWLFPAFALLLGGFGIIVFLYKSRGAQSKPKGADKIPSWQAENGYLEKIDKELKDFES